MLEVSNKEPLVWTVPGQRPVPDDPTIDEVKDLLCTGYIYFKLRIAQLEMSSRGSPVYEEYDDSYEAYDAYSWTGADDE